MRRSPVILIGLSAALVAVGMPATAAPSGDAFSRAVTQVRSHASSTGYAEGQTFTLKDVVSDADGTEHVRMHRYAGGLPVLGGDLVVHLGKGNAWKGASHTLKAVPTVNRTPRVSASAAGTTALATSEAKDRTVSGSKLVVDAGDGAPALAYEVVVSGVYADGTPSRLHVLVDARSGTVRDAWEGIQTEGVGHTLHSGTVPVGTTVNGTTYELRDGDRGGHRTYDFNGGLGGSAWLITSATNEFGDGTMETRNTAGADAQYGAAMTWDYYKNVHGRLGIRNDGVATHSRVHYMDKYSNAFWDDNCFCMSYGDGDLSKGWKQVTSLDVAGHEMSHGLTSNTADLRYSGESGGLNEATSDILGTLVEFYAANSNDPGDYTIGEKVRTTVPALRYMDKPSKDGKSVDCWNNEVKKLNVHYSSGVANHFFYLLAVGSGASSYGDSPTCDGSTVTGIGNEKAGAIWFRALTVYMSSGTSFSGARSATLSAAADLYGNGSTEYQAVAAAWSAVNV